MQRCNWSLIALLLLGMLLSQHISFAQASGQEEGDVSQTGGESCRDLGQVLGPPDFGIAAGQVVADASAVLLGDGRIRLYVFATGQGICSAVSSDGLKFQVEDGSRSRGAPWGMPRVVRLSDGRLRMFFNQFNGIASAISTDGLTFTQEPGMRITETEAGMGATTTATVVPRPGGGFRMYFSDLPRPGEPPQDHLIKSAISEDMLNWKVEQGIRIGPGATALTGSAEHPFALLNTDGSVTLFYARFGRTIGPTAGIWRSTSSDGLTFASEQFTGINGNDPDVLRLPDGSLLMYYGIFSRDVGGTIRVARCEGVTSVEETWQEENLPTTIRLFQNYPNPFNPLTIINYQLPIGNWVTLTVYDLLGREVQTLVNGELNAGEHSVMFTATGLPSGVYFYQLKAGSFIQTKKMLIIK